MLSVYYFEFTALFFALLIVITVVDITSSLIPNVLVVAIMILGLTGQFVSFGFPGIFDGIAGFVCGLLLFMPFYLRGGMGAGDVKLMAAIGCFLGAQTTLWAVAYSLVAGGIIGIVWIVMAGEIWPQTYRYYSIAKTFFLTRQFIYIKPRASSIAMQRFPYSTAIIAGTYVTFLLNL